METYECAVAEKKGFWPPPMSSHMAVVDKETKKIYIYGGFEKYTATSAVYEYDIATSQWTKLEVKEASPPARSGHSIAFYQNSIYVYGGISGEGDLLNDIWVFSIAELTWKNIEFDTSSPAPSVFSLYNYSLVVTIL